jgi:tetratricopeptide (TPR) repeat protein
MARSWYSLLLRGMGRAAEARQESRRAAELDPFAVIPAYNDGWQCYIDRDYDCAIEQYRRAISTGNYPSAWRGLALALAHRGSGDSAVRAAQEALALAPQRVDFLADLAYVQARAGLEKEARETLRRAKIETWEGFNVARAHVALGEIDSTFAWLERSSWRWPHRATLSDPALDPVRSDPRLSALSTRIAREMGLQ